MRVGEPHALAREPVDVRRFDFRRAVATDIPVAEVVGEDDDDVGLGRLKVRRRGGGGQTREQQQSGKK